MNRKFIIILIILISQTLFADSLQDGVDLFNQGSSFYQIGDYENAYSYLNQSIIKFDSLNDSNNGWLLNSNLWAGAAAFNLGYYNEAEIKYKVALDIAQLNQDKQYMVNIISALANLQYHIGEFSVASNWYMQLSQILEQLNNKYDAIKTLEFAGYCKILSEEYLDAYKIYNSILTSTNLEIPDNEIAGIYSMQGNCLYNLQDLQGALFSYKQSVLLMEQYENTVELSQYYGWVGKIYFDLTENDLALRYYKKSLNLSQLLNSKEDESRVLAYLGFFYASINDYILGIDYYEKSLALSLELENNEFIISAYESLLWIYGISENSEKLFEINSILIDLYKVTNAPLKLAKIYNDLGEYFSNQKSFNESIPLFTESIKIFRDYGINDKLALSLFNLGLAYKQMGNRSLSEKNLNESIYISLNNGEYNQVESILDNYDNRSRLDILEGLVLYYKSEEKSKKLMHLKNNIGTLYYSNSDYYKALDYYNEAKIMAIEFEDYKTLCITLHNISQSKAALSIFDEALQINNEALDISKKYGFITIEANLWNSIGELYRAWGWYDKSLTCYSESESIFEEIDDREGLASVYNNIGQSLRASGKYLDSVKFYNMALNISDNLSDQKLKAINLSNLGEAHRALGNNDEALSYYLKALKIDIDLKNLQGINIRKNNIALLYFSSGENQKAIDTFKEGITYWRQIGNLRQEAIALKNLWLVYFNMGKYNLAADALTKVVNIQENLRLTAQGTVRREYLESQVSSYRNLAATYYYLKDPMNSLYYMELSRGKYLLEQMGIKQERVYDWNTYSSFINEMPSDTSLISYSLTDINLIQAISVTNNRVSTTLINIDKDFIESMNSEYGVLIDRSVGETADDDFTKILKFYRLILARPIQSRSTKEAMVIIGKYLYLKLIEPFKEELDNTNKLIVIPDGILGTVPFEVLQNENDRYLIETHDISYSQSLVISQMIKERGYKDNRDPLLAFGGAIYETDKVNDYNVNTNLDMIRREVIEMIRTGSDTRKAYVGMGLGSWQNLPGTLEEVNLLSEIVPKSLIITGKDATEESVFEKSNSGELANYKVLHFATHGIVVPEIPEMSAVVLSQNINSLNNRDGYLTMGEIATLKINADFVNLSACETGLGKIYQGEGVVGLTQSFLVAGANSVSVSLWQVSDESTMRFMAGVYSLVENEDITYSAAIAEMKRTFLKDEKYKEPFYWAPFVLYGNNQVGL